MAILLVGCNGGSESATQTSPESGPGLTDLRTVDEFRSLFNGAQGKARVVLLLSPT